MISNWDMRFAEVAKLVASWSKDRSTQVGCVIVLDRRILATGYNGFPRGVDDDIDARHERPLKYSWTEHAERNAIFNAAHDGIRLTGGTAYCTMAPCADCARALVQSGIARLVAPPPNLECPRWGDSSRIALEILAEGHCTFCSR